MTGTVGIAIPAYGRGRHLRETLESALRQTRRPSEIVVVDDCSPDETGEVARSFGSKGVVYVRNPVNLGVPANYNASLARLKTDYVMILEDHDVIDPTYVEKCAGILDEHADVALTATWIETIDEQTGKSLQVYSTDFDRVQEGRRLAEYLVTNTTAPLSLTALIRRSALAGLEPWFDSKYWWYADIHLWIRLALRGGFGCVREPLLRMRTREPSHFLADKDWEGLICCDRIRRDAWGAVFPQSSLKTRWKWMRYCAVRDFEGARLLLSQLARGRSDIPQDAAAMLSPLGRTALAAMAKMPHLMARVVRASYRLVASRT